MANYGRRISDIAEALSADFVIGVKETAPGKSQAVRVPQELFTGGGSAADLNALAERVEDVETTLPEKVDGSTTIAVTGFGAGTYPLGAGPTIPLAEASEAAALAGTAGPEGGGMSVRRAKFMIDNAPGNLPAGVEWRVMPAGSGWKFALCLSDDSIVMGITENDTFWSNLDPTVIAPSSEVTGLLPGRNVVWWGDSLTAGAGASRGPNVALATATGFSVNNRGIGGQTSAQIAARQGGIPITVTVDGNVIPASGGVAVSAKSVNILYNSGSYVGTAGGTLAGIAGTMSTDAAGAWTFTRTAAGAETPCPVNSVFVPTTATQHESDMTVIWSGRNGFAYNTPQQIIDNIVGMANRLKPKVKRLIVLSVMNGSTEGIGSTSYDQIKVVNDYLRRLFPDCFADVRAHMIAHGLTEAGITPTSGDLADIAADLPPRSLRSDNVHGTDAYYDCAGNFVGRMMKAKGWVY